jgi:hypothetical protein
MAIQTSLPEDFKKVWKHVSGQNLMQNLQCLIKKEYARHGKKRNKIIFPYSAKHCLLSKRSFKERFDHFTYIGINVTINS